MTMFTETIRRNVSRQPAARVVQPVKVKPVGLDSPIEKMGAPVQFGRGAEIYSEGEPTDYLYYTKSSMVPCATTGY